MVGLFAVGPLGVAVARSRAVHGILLEQLGTPPFSAILKVTLVLIFSVFLSFEPIFSPVQFVAAQRAPIDLIVRLRIHADPIVIRSLGG